MSKIRFSALAIIVASVGLNAQSNLTFLRNDTIPVISQSDTLLNPWSGGLNFCQHSSIDLNLDGTDDLFVFDRSGNRITTYINNGTPGMVDYHVAPQYIDAFPQLDGWAILRDYNCDGKMDIYTYGAGMFGGVDLYENTSTIQNGLSFVLVKHLLQANVTPNSTDTIEDIHVTKFDIPSIRDIDHDNDLDILTFDPGGTTVQWYRNYSQETYGVCDSLNYVLETNCWGLFAEANSNSVIFLNQTCSPVPIAPGNSSHQRQDRHSGSCLECINTDGDTDEDLLIGDLTNPRIVYTQNGGTQTSANMVAQDASFPAYDTALYMNLFVCGFHIDVNNDNLKDLVLSPNASQTVENFNSNWMYLNVGANDSVVLEFQQRNFMQDGMIDCGEGAVPRWFDYDSDGDLDLFIGNYGYYQPSGIYPSKIALYKNTGNFNDPEFTFITDDFANLYANSYNIISPVPTFADLDGDGDKDMLVGEITGHLYLFRKDPGPADNFVLVPGFYQAIDVGSNSAPQLIDIDRDGKVDLLIGEQSGNLNYFRNTGTAAAPTFALVTNMFGGVSVNAPMSISGFSIPCLWDNNGQYQLLVGSERGFIYRYDNIDSNLSGNFTLTDSMYVTTHEGLRVAPWAGYINGDTLIDMIIGNYAGGVVLYYGDVTSDVQSITQTITPVLEVFPNPANNEFRISGWNTAARFPATLSIVGVNGQQVKSAVITNKDQPVFVGDLPSGCYFGTVTDAEGITSALRFVVTNNDER
jgi:hypothetical protein